jgi:hypothetical protein
MDVDGIESVRDGCEWEGEHDMRMRAREGREATDFKCPSQGPDLWVLSQSSLLSNVCRWVLSKDGAPCTQNKDGWWAQRLVANTGTHKQSRTTHACTRSRKRTRAQAHTHEHTHKHTHAHTHVCMDTCMHSWKHAPTHAFIQAFTDTSLTLTHTHTFTYIHTHIHTQTQTQTQTHTHTHTHPHTDTHAHMHAYAHRRTQVCTHMQSTLAAHRTAPCCTMRKRKASHFALAHAL